MMGDGEPIDYGDASKYVNDSSIEMAWAVQTYERANIHMNLLIAVQPATLRLSKHQQTIYERFRSVFPDLPVIKITELELKGSELKPKWREFCESFQEVVDDFNMGTLLRMDAGKCYSDENTVIVPRIIFLAVEIARNLEGVNDVFKAEFTADHTLNVQKELEEEHSETKSKAEEAENAKGGES